MFPVHSQGWWAYSPDSPDGSVSGLGEKREEEPLIKKEGIPRERTPGSPGVTLLREVLSTPRPSPGVELIRDGVELTREVLSTTDIRPQGKVAELRLELNSGGKKDKNHSAKKIALKKIVANMTMSNNDMVALFPDVVGCMRIPSLEIKKM